MSDRVWHRAPVPTLCGGCNALIDKGTPLLRITMARGGRVLRFVRCAACEGPAPPDLPALVERAPIAPSALHRVSTLLPLGPKRIADWKMRAAEREREPGEEG
jgi:hypothetical protein